MVCSTVVAGTLLTDSVWVVVVVVVGAGVSTVVQEVRVMAAIASSGVRIISFFIVGIVPSKDKSRHVLRADVFGTKILHPKRGRISPPERWKRELCDN